MSAIGNEALIDGIEDVLIEYDEDGNVFGTSGAGAYFLAKYLSESDWLAGLIREKQAEALRLAADRMPAFHDRDVPEWAITSACRWLRGRAEALEATS